MNLTNVQVLIRMHDARINPNLIGKKCVQWKIIILILTNWNLRINICCVFKYTRRPQTEASKPLRGSADIIPELSQAGMEGWVRKPEAKREEDEQEHIPVMQGTQLSNSSWPSIICDQ